MLILVNDREACAFHLVHSGIGVELKWKQESAEIGRTLWTWQNALDMAGKVRLALKAISVEIS